MDALDAMRLALAVPFIALLIFIGYMELPKAPTENHRGPQCAIAYPRGFEFSRAVPEDGASCGTIAVSWRACVPSWNI